MQKIKILHLPTSVGGNSYGLSRAERALGLQSDVLTQEFNYLNYDADLKLDLSNSKSNMSRRFKRLKMFFHIRNKYNIFHFNYGASLFGYPISSSKKNYIDLNFYPKKSKLFVTYNGCDARQKFKNIDRNLKYCVCEECDNSGYKSENLDCLKIKAIEKMSKHVEHIWVLNPDLLHFLPKEKTTFLPYSIYNFNQEIYLPKLDKKLKIIHASTNRSIKGSNYIIEALKNLKRKYPNLIHYELIENKSNAEALILYKQADLIIDQILIGWYGAFAVETMLMGKPVIARIEKEDLQFIPKNMKNDLLNTIIDANPDNIYDTLEKCIHDRKFLKQKSKNSIEYAKKWHNPEFIASITKNEYEKALY